MEPLKRVVRPPVGVPTESPRVGRMTESYMGSFPVEHQGASLGVPHSESVTAVVSGLACGALTPATPEPAADNRGRMSRRFGNVVIFAAALLATGLLVIGIVALTDGDSSGWRAVIGSLLAFALAGSVALRSASKRRQQEF